MNCKPGLLEGSSSAVGWPHARTGMAHRPGAEHLARARGDDPDGERAARAPAAARRADHARRLPGPRGPVRARAGPAADERPRPEPGLVAEPPVPGDGVAGEVRLGAAHPGPG